MHAAGAEGGRVNGAIPPTEPLVRIPNMRLANPLNGSGGTTRGARMAAARRAKAERSLAKMLTSTALRQACGPARILTPTWHVVITLVRVSPRAFDSDGTAAAFKHVRDGVADALGIDDGDPRLRWDYASRRGQPHFHGVEIFITGDADDYPADVPEMVEQAL
jgi:hypothetical protein